MLLKKEYSSYFLKHTDTANATICSISVVLTVVLTIVLTVVLTVC